MEILVLAIIIILILGIYKFICRKYLLKNLTYSCYFSVDEVYEGEQIEFVEEIANDKFLSIPWMKTDFTTSKWLEFSETRSNVFDQQRFVSNIFMLKGHRSIERRWKVHCAKRGIFTIDKVILAGSDLFGGHYGFITATVNLSITVLPNPLKSQDLEFSQYLPIGEINIQRHLVADPFEIVGSKEYTQRDSVSRIDWTATARMQKLMVRETMYSVSPKMSVILNLQSREDEFDATLDRKNIEKAIKLCAGLFQTTLFGSAPVSFFCNTSAEHIPIEILEDSDFLEANAAGGADSIMNLMRILSYLPFFHTRDFSTYLKMIENRIDDDSDIVIVSSYTNAQINEFIASKQHCFLVPAICTEGDDEI